jgi:Cu2+-exporting ATPase
MDIWAKIVFNVVQNLFGVIEFLPKRGSHLTKTETVMITDSSTCFHCGLPLPKNQRFTAEIQSQTRQFCCLGCQSVCAAIYEAGMEGFYQRTPEGQVLAPPAQLPQDSALYDLDEVQQEFVTDMGAVREIHLLVEGIHCAACVWLIEHRLRPMTGVVSAKVNLTAKQLLLRWNNNSIKLSNILNQLAKIGYAAAPFDPEAAEGQLKRQNRAFLFRMAFAGFTMMNLLWISIALYAGADQGEYKTLFYWVGFVLATPTLFYSGWPFLKGAWTGLKARHLGMDLPIALGATTSYLYSAYVTYVDTFLGGSGGAVYFDTVVNFIFVILIGRYLEGMSKRHAVMATQRLMELQPKVAIKWKNNQEDIVPVRSLKVGDVVLIKAGSQVPVDGVVLAGCSAVDEAMLSGESVPVEKTSGDKVSAGTYNTHSSLEVKVTGILKQTALGRIIRLVEEAQASKAPIQCTADKIVPWFVAFTLGLAALTLLFWFSAGFETALMNATAVLIITCPCAFGLGTPMAIAVASGQGAKHGILVKNGAVLENLSKIKHFVFDKTGTLTQGKRQVQHIQVLENREYFIQAIAALEQYSEHNVGQAIVHYAKQQGLMAQLTVDSVQSQTGKGIIGKVAGETYWAGTLAWLQQHDIAIDPSLQQQAENWQNQAQTCVHCAKNGQHIGVFSIADQLRPQAKALIQQLEHNGIQLTLLSGDQKPVAEAIARQLSDHMAVIADVLPEDKNKVIAQLQKQGQQVAMIGDGVNDAPALVRADVGIAVGSGTDVSVESADIVLMHDELHNILLASQLSQRTLQTIKQNIGISIIYNMVMVPLAMAGFITPLVAAIAMPISSLLVIGNAARIKTVFRQGPSSHENSPTI